MTDVYALIYIENLMAWAFQQYDFEKVFVFDNVCRFCRRSGVGG